MFRKNRFGATIGWEAKSLSGIFSLMIPAMAVSFGLLMYGWSKFGGPCRVSMFFNIPGGGVTVGAYYVLWGMMFLLFGGEVVVILTRRRHMATKTLLLYHLAAHLCLFLWYPLFFTTLSQILALGVITAALVLLIAELKYACRTSELLLCSCIGKGCICAVYVYLNFVFLIIN